MNETGDLMPIYERGNPVPEPTIPAGPGEPLRVEFIVFQVGFSESQVVTRIHGTGTHKSQAKNLVIVNSGEVEATPAFSPVISRLRHTRPSPSLERHVSFIQWS
jgi:hypothetical protein